MPIKIRKIKKEKKICPFKKKKILHFPEESCTHNIQCTEKINVVTTALLLISLKNGKIYKLLPVEYKNVQMTFIDETIKFLKVDTFFTFVILLIFGDRKKKLKKAVKKIS